jgi:hypothetical protein
MSVSISPVFNGVQFFDNDGLPLSGGLLFQYEAGSTSVDQTTYADNVGDVANSNPIVLDSSGRMDTDLWLTDGAAYNLVLTLADGTTFLTGVDNVIGVIASKANNHNSTNVWNLTDPDTPIYVAPTQFALLNNHVFEYSIGNRVQIEYEPNQFLYGTVTAVSFNDPHTFVTLVNDTLVQNAGMSAVYWSSLTTTAKAVDAGAVTFSIPTQYTTPKTVGYEINQLKTGNSNTNTRVDSTYIVWPTSGTGNYSISPSPPLSTYSIAQNFVVRFTSPYSGGGATMNVNGLGAVPLRAYGAGGAIVDPIIISNQVTQIGFDGSMFIVLDPVQAVIGAIPRGQQVFGSPGTFTVPAGVTSIKVTVIGGGAGGGGATFTNQGDPEGPVQIVYPGQTGGAGGTGFRYLNVSPGQQFAVSLGSGGAGGVAFGGTGGDGGTTTFGPNLVQATGGKGGNGGYSGGPLNGIPGYGSIADYGYFNVGFQIGQTPKGTGGNGGNGIGSPGIAGTAGMAVIEW